jgi:hypothetical protein
MGAAQNFGSATLLITLPILNYPKTPTITNSKMSDNTIVKAVAGTCVTFSFILAGRYCWRKLQASTYDVVKAMRSLNPT